MIVRACLGPWMWGYREYKGRIRWDITRSLAHSGRVKACCGRLDAVYCFALSAREIHGDQTKYRQCLIFNLKTV